MTTQIENISHSAQRKMRVRKKNIALIIDAAQQEFVNVGFKGASMKRIAERAGLPRSNVHYYFKTIVELYGAVLSDILETWNTTFDTIKEEDDPKAALTAYIRAKVMYSKSNPEASRIFASEIIHGAPHLSVYLKTDFRQWVDSKSSVIQKWIDDGEMDPIDPTHLLFFIWSSSQHYADFGVQVLAAMDKERLTDNDYNDIAGKLTTFVLKGCGLA